MVANIHVDASGRECVVSLRQSMWHDQGTVVQQEMTDEQLVELAGLGFEVVKDPLFSHERRTGGNNVEVAQYERVDGWSLLRRQDTGAVFGCVSAGFRVFQNREMIQLMRQIANNTPLIWETAGALGANAQTVWCMARLPELQIALGNDKMDVNMLVTNGHGNAKALGVVPTVIRAVCENTVRAATSVNRVQRMANTEERDYSQHALSVGYSINHNQGLDRAVAEIGRAYAQFVASAARTKELYTQLATVKVTDTEAAEYWNELFKRPSVADETERSRKLRENREIDRAQDLTKIWNSGTNKGLDTEDTLFTAFQSVVEYVDHVAPARTAKTRFTRSMFGDGVGLKRDAWNLAFDHLSVG